VAAPLIIPTASPCTARAAKSQAVPCAAAKSASPTQAVASPPATTGCRPNRSESLPKRTSAGTRTIAYVAKIVVSTSGEKPNLFA
jgi:hypothetical protein